MRTPLEIYEKYRVPSWLQMHQLRVAAVGAMLADRIPSVDRAPIVLCGLFHDMANILKIDLSKEGNLAVHVEEDVRQELQQLQNEYRVQYGPDEHVASIAIGREIGLPEVVLTMIDNMRFTKSEWVVREGSLEMKIAKYSDLRVAPFGIVSMLDRFSEAATRYRKQGFDGGSKETDEFRERMDNACHELERIVLEKAGIDSATINDDSAAPIIEEMRGYEV